MKIKHANKKQAYHVKKRQTRRDNLAKECIKINREQHTKLTGKG